MGAAALSSSAVEGDETRRGDGADAPIAADWRVSQRDVDLPGRALVAEGRSAAGGDVGAARAHLTGALGADDPAVVGVAMAALGEAEAAAIRHGHQRGRLSAMDMRPEPRITCEIDTPLSSAIPAHDPVEVSDDDQSSAGDAADPSAGDRPRL